MPLERSFWLRKQHDAMYLMVPAEVRYVRDIPVLGSGKIDFVGVAKLVREAPDRTPRAKAA